MCLFPFHRVAPYVCRTVFLEDSTASIAHTPHLKVDKPILKCHDGKQRFSERGVSQDPKTGFVHIIADRPGPPGHRKGGVNRVLLQPWVIVRMTREKNLFNQIIYWEQNSFY